MGIDRDLAAVRTRLAGGPSPLGLSIAALDWLAHLAQLPGKQAELAAELAAAAIATADPQPPADQRFSGPGWERWPYNVLAATFTATEQLWAHATSGVTGVDPHNADRVAFSARQFLDALSPANSLLTNPELQRETFEQGGENLRRGLELMREDAERMLTGDPPPGTGDFIPGESVACTPGKVVMRNRLVELIQYSPSTQTVHPEPLLIVPAWIMKYYILDLSPHNSLVRYLVERGHTVFMLSWRNPGSEDRDLGIEDYLELGIFAALDAVAAIVPDRPVHAAGYCLGGTLLAIAAAALAREPARQPLGSVSLFAAQTDFTEPGELSLFIDEEQVTVLENLMHERGYLDGKQMGATFQALRSTDLVWSPLIREYLLGDRQLPNDLMAWNADATRLPYRMHSEYLRGLYLGNDLFEGRFRVRGAPVALRDIRVPIFAVSTQRDHVAPWRSVYKLSLAVNTELSFVLTSGGHNAGIVSEPGHKGRSFQLATRAAADPYLDPDRFAAETPVTDGSWWEAWQRWLRGHSGRRRTPPPIGNRQQGYAVLADAPGAYVLER